MQFFPDSSTGYAESAAEKGARKLLQGGGAFFLDGAGRSGLGKGPSFNDVLSGLKEYNSKNVPGIPAGFSSVKDDNSLIKGRHLQQLGKDLLEKGVDEDVVSRFMGKVNAGADFPGVGRMMGLASGRERKSDPLDEQESLVFNAMLQKMGFSPDEIVDLEMMAHEGNGAALLQKLQGRVDGSFSLSAQEAGVLGRALDLSQDLSKHLNSAFNGKQELVLDSASFKSLMAPAQEHFTRLQAEQAKLLAALPASVKDMLNKAALEKNAQLVTGNRGSRKSDRSELLMRDGATSRQNDEEGLKSQSIAASLIDARNKAADSTKEAFAEAEEQALAEENAAKFKNSLKGRTGTGKSADEQALPEQSGGKAVFAARVDSVSGPLFTQPEQSAPSGQAQAAGQGARHDARIFEQVQQGILRNAMDGSSNITLRLDPPELGKLTLSLTVLNGEIKALIRTDKVETTSAVSEQLSQLKASLEEQGFKVASLEVETRPQNATDHNEWNGAEQHNMEQEAREKARLLQLNRSRAEGGSVLARNLQLDAHQATIAEQGLHIIA